MLAMADCVCPLVLSMTAGAQQTLGTLFVSIRVIRGNVMVYTRKQHNARIASCDPVPNDVGFALSSKEGVG